MADFNGTNRPDHDLSSANSTGGSWQTEAVRGVQMAATLLIFLVGVPLNGVVVWALGHPHRRYLARRGSSGGTGTASSFRVYVLNLALADLVLLLRTPLMLGYLAHNNSWPFGLTLCRVTVFLRGLGLYASAFLLCAVAVERCLCLLRPVWARLRRPHWAVSLACGAIWLLAAVMSAPYLVSADLIEAQTRLQCVDSGEHDTVLFVIETVAGFILPILVFLGSNLIVLVTIRKAVPSTSTSHSSRTTKIYQVLFFTMLLFISCWIPYFFCRFLRTLAKGRADHATLYGRASKGTYISLYLVYIKSALNPVLYALVARGLGKAVRASLVSTIERLFNEDSSESTQRKLSRTPRCSRDERV
ncbi:C3a anaphylatoxin chemotactic receptor [Neosynchiropus ocellatus]